MKEIPRVEGWKADLMKARVESLSMTTVAPTFSDLTRAIARAVNLKLISG